MDKGRLHLLRGEAMLDTMPTEPGRGEEALRALDDRRRVGEEERADWVRFSLAMAALAGLGQGR